MLWIDYLISFKIIKKIECVCEKQFKSLNLNINYESKDFIQIFIRTFKNSGRKKV